MVYIPTKTFYNLDSVKRDRITKASINEFGKRSFDDAKLSNIIKESRIPRGSFYQYFDDKKDLYKHIFDIIKNKKIEFMSEELKNEADLPFLEVFRLLYHQGIQFAYAYPDFVEIGKHMFNLNKELYDELVGNGFEMAKQYYVGYIEADKTKGRIREDVDSNTFAGLVISLTTNIAIEELSEDKFDLEKMLDKVDSLINIFKKGIE